MSINVRLSKKQSIKATVASGTIMARTFGELLDVKVENVSDKYLIMYDGTQQKYVAVNPDDVLVNAVQEPVSPGLPTEFKERLSVDLDNEIDFDGGTW
nr:hypothetical protein [uncultured Mediterranean phage uvMED]|tara:strand:- start:2507 stop:2800 length:294 start_codon:yes stop_codon:yes gene_type:complete